MSEEQIAQQLGMTEEQVAAAQTDDGQEVGNQQNEVELSPIEQEAFDQGWRPQGEFQGPDEKWKTAKEYVNDGKWLAKLRESNQRVDNLERDFNERLENANKLNEARRKSEIESLKKKQRTAVDNADTDAYDEAQQQIDNLDAQQDPAPAQSAAVDPSLEAWNAKNEWIMDPANEKTPVAHGVFNNYMAQHPNAAVTTALAHVDKQLNKLFPADNTNPRRSQPNTNESGGKSPRRSNKALTMNDLSSAERAEWSQYGKMMYKTEEAFLKAVADLRKA